MISCEFTEEYLRFIEPYASSVAYNGNVLQAEAEGHTYQFSADITEKDGLAFVQVQEMLCALLEKEDPQYLFNLVSVPVGGYAIAFGEYFVRIYGEEAFINSMLYPSRTEKYTGKTLDEILDDWCADMADPQMDALVQYANICTMW